MRETNRMEYIQCHVRRQREGERRKEEEGEKEEEEEEGGGGRGKEGGGGGHEQHTLCKICCVSWIHACTFLINLVVLLYSKISPFACGGRPLALPLVVAVAVGVAPGAFVVDCGPLVVVRCTSAASSSSNCSR